MTLVVVPVLLMLGSVYVHAAATDLEEQATRLAEEKALAETEAERLEIKVTQLSGPGRIRAIASEDLGMRDPAGEDLRTYENGGGEDGAGAQKGEQ